MPEMNKGILAKSALSQFGADYGDASGLDKIASNNFKLKLSALKSDLTLVGDTFPDGEGLTDKLSNIGYDALKEGKVITDKQSGMGLYVTRGKTPMIFLFEQNYFYVFQLPRSVAESSASISRASRLISEAKKIKIIESGEHPELTKLIDAMNSRLKTKFTLKDLSEYGSFKNKAKAFDKKYVKSPEELPKHVKLITDNQEAFFKELGLDPDWHNGEVTHQTSASSILLKDNVILFRGMYITQVLVFKK